MNDEVEVVQWPPEDLAPYWKFCVEEEVAEYVPGGVEIEFYVLFALLLIGGFVVLKYLK